ncbi:MAG: 2-oxoacid:ferredoxin oxidoreductase subunit gamma [Chloroflexi bacterium]|nr:MAG: 2-oxoacid:ferredoxin oxidoreductase subunit gamma [Anaerolineaceae bacterium 4572_32.2]RLC78889.1 MAG: 2-oxoacid:ferredoxin oxidoreductase subunit gamma [Chloroflexota bacterium]RLC84542.1 MAG: 2-oxoacid:ferredoxin oxidoreductase subunit gamma [Chloroflexota bacterium]HEY72602.1 2-oxoacid:ferredoxin oxidoreductase subunit gamma [Thermoflexia bacterium]
MQQEIVISGFGGQGTLFAGQLLAYAAMDSGNHVTWFPSYGPEMRGGKARCTVIVAGKEIGAPLVRRPSAAIVLNIPSMEAFEPAIKPGGVLVVNSSLIPQKSERDDIRVIYIPATDMAIELGNARMANVICLSALVEATGVVSLEAVKQALQDHLPERHHKLLGLNYEAMDRGAALIGN